MRVCKLVFKLTLAFSLLAPFPSFASVELFDGRSSAGLASYFGYQYKLVDGGESSQFEAYRDVPRGFVWETLHLYAEWEDPELPYYLRLSGRDIFQEDQVLGLEAGERGDWRLKLGYKETPRTIDDGDRFIRRTGTAEAAKVLVDGLGIRLSYRHDDKDGRMPAAEPGFHQRIDWETDMLKAALELARSEGLMQLAYEYQNFRDGVGAHVSHLPLEGGGQGGGEIAGASTGVLHDPAPPGGHTHLGRFAGSWALPFWRSRIAWSASGSDTLQDSGPKGAVGEVLNFVQDYSLYMRPAGQLAATVKYRYYYFDNVSPSTLTGEGSRVGVQANTSPVSFLRQDARVDLDYPVSGTLTARAGLGWERLRSWANGPGLTDNFGAGPGFTFAPARGVKLLLDYRWSNARRELTASSMFIMIKGLDVRANGRYVSGSRDSDGLVQGRGRAWSAGTEAAWTPLPWLGITASYAHRDGHEATDPGFGILGSKDRNDSFGAGLSATAFSGRAGLSANCIFNRGSVNTSAGAEPPVSRPLDREARAEFSWLVRTGMTVSLKYSFEKSGTGGGTLGETGYIAHTALARLACRF